MLIAIRHEKKNKYKTECKYAIIFWTCNPQTNIEVGYTQDLRQRKYDLMKKDLDSVSYTYLNRLLRVLMAINYDCSALIKLWSWRIKNESQSTWFRLLPEVSMWKSTRTLGHNYANVVLLVILCIFLAPRD